MMMAGFPAARWKRPALKRLIADIEAGQIDVIVVAHIVRTSSMPNLGRDRPRTFSIGIVSADHSTSIFLGTE
jgi:DNA invertase Pin-like site-specific DNA recombinase